jgi:hypothetical protein
MSMVALLEMKVWMPKVTWERDRVRAHDEKS